MTCPAPPRGCTTQFCFHCLSMNPHCGSKCKKPKEANILRQKWKKERTARQKLTYETARQFQSNTETKQANEEHKRELREATESKTAMEVNLFEMRLYDKQMESSPSRRSTATRKTEKQEDEELLQSEIEGVSAEFVRITKQPDLIKFGTMRPYQLESLNWMAGLYHNGMNGILADEMGLGKTLQSIAILAHLNEHQNVTGK